MAWQRVGARKVRSLRERLGMPEIYTAHVRGNTGHRVDLLMDGGDVVHYWPRDGDMAKASYRWAGDETSRRA